MRRARPLDLPSAARKLTASCVVTLSRACWLLHSLPGADHEIFNKGSNGGTKAIPVGILTASGARAPAHSPSPFTMCAARAQAIRLLERGPIESRAASPMQSLDEEFGYTDRGTGQMGEGERHTSWKARRAPPARSGPREEGHHPPPAGARRLLRLRAWWLSEHRSDGLLRVHSGPVA